MRCTCVVSITLVKGIGGHGDAELEASARAVSKKYAAKPVILINKTITRSALKANPEGVIKQIADEIKDALGVGFDAATAHARDDMNTAGGIGLYWACHGNSAGTSPSAEKLAKYTALFYRQGVRFVKINYNSCNSAGRNDTYDNNGSLTKFCNSLATELATPTGIDVNGQLQSLVVAGYTTTVELVDPDDNFYKGMSPKPAYIQSFQSTAQPQLPAPVHNTKASYPVGKPRELAPLVPQQQLDELQGKQGSIGTLNNKVVAYKANQTPKRNDGRDIQKAIGKFKESSTYKKMQAYLRCKPVLRFDRGAWVKASLLEYTDNKSIYDMVQFVSSIDIALKLDPYKKDFQTTVAVIVP